MCGIAAAAIALMAMALPGLAQAEIQRPDPQVNVTRTPAGPLVPGQEVGFEVTVTNQGGSPTPNENWSFSIGRYGQGIDFVSVEADPSYWLGISGPCQLYNGSTVNCGREVNRLGGTVLEPGETTPPIHIVTRVAADAPADPVFPVTFSIQTCATCVSQPDVDLPVTQGPVMELSMEHLGIFRRGQVGHYAIDLKNSSPSTDATGLATITDTLPDGLSFNSASSTGNFWDCVGSSGQNVSCVGNGNLAHGESAPTLDLAVDVDSGAPDFLTNTASAETQGGVGQDLNSATDETPIFSAAAERAVFTVGASGKADPENGTGSYFSVDNPTMDINPLSGDFSATDELNPDAKPVMTGVIDGDSVFISESSIEIPEFTGPPITTALPATLGKIPVTQVHTTVVPTDDWTGTIDESGNISLEMPSKFAYNVRLVVPLQMQFANCESGPVDLAASGTFTNGNGVLSGDDFTIGAAASCTGLDGQLYGQHLNPTLAAVFINQWLNTTGGSEAGEAHMRLETHLTDPNSGPVLDLENSVAVFPTVKVVDGEVDPAGSTGGYDLTVTNTSSSDTTGAVTITEDLPEGASFLSGTSAGDYWDCSASAGASVSCTSDGSPITAGDSAPTLRLNLTLGGAAYPLLTTVAQASGGGANGTTTTPNRTSVGIDGKSFTLNLSQTQRSGNTFLGQANWTVRAPKNLLNVQPRTPVGTAGAGDKINLRIHAPAGVTFDRLEPPAFGTLQGWTCSAQPPAEDGTSITECTISAISGFFGYSFPRASLAYNVSGEAAAGESPTAPIEAQGWLIGALPKTDILETTTTPVLNPHFSLSMAEAGDFRVGGAGGTFTLGLTNDGTGSTTDNPTTITDVLPQGLIVEGIDDGGYWDCSASAGRKVACNNATAPPLFEGDPFIEGPFDGELGPGASPPPIEIDFSVGQPDSPVVTNGARAESAATETATASTTINTSRPELAVNSTHSGDFTVGENGSYRLLVSNSGAADTDGSEVIVTDTLPAGLSYVGSSSAGDYWSCAAEGAAVSCSSEAVIEGNDSAPVLRLAVGVADEAVPGVTNLVRVTGGGSLAADASDATAVNPAVKVNRRARLARVVVKPNARNLRKGKKAVFKVRVKNNGNAKAKRARVCAKVPKRLLRVQGKACKQLGQLKPGQVKTRKFAVRLKHRGLHRKSINVRFKANARKVKPRSARATIRVKGGHRNH